MIKAFQAYKNIKATFENYLNLFHKLNYKIQSKIFIEFL